ncbi:MAG: hypothetical protein HYW91_01560 [Candidatus Sungbacteria bacterium]|nr:hypothetical protein [Candidatus Sungbacteria bacterium]
MTISVLTFIFGIIYGLFSFYLPIFVEGTVKNIALVGILLALVEIMGIGLFFWARCFWDFPLYFFSSQVFRS